MRDRIGTTTKVTEDYVAKFGTDIAMPDMEVDVPDIGVCVITHSETIQCGIIPRNDSENTIAISIVKLTDEGGYKGVGLVHLMGKSEALLFAKHLIQVALNHDDLLEGSHERE